MRQRDHAGLHVASSLTVVVDGANVESFLALPSSVTSPNQRPYILWLVPCQSVAKLSLSVQGILSRAWVSAPPEPDDTLRGGENHRPLQGEVKVAHLGVGHV